MRRCGDPSRLFMRSSGPTGSRCGTPPGQQKNRQNRTHGKRRTQRRRWVFVRLLACADDYYRTNSYYYRPVVTVGTSLPPSQYDTSPCSSMLVLWPLADREGALARAGTIHTKAVRNLLRQEARRSPASRYEHRLHGVLLVASGLSHPKVAEIFGEDPRTVRRWTAAFQRHGLAGLRDVKRPGRPSSLDAEQQLRLRRDLTQPPATFELCGGTWNGNVLSEHLRRSYKMDLGVRQCQRLLKRLAISSK